ncbi:alginate lyase family protein [Pontibacillus marinus]|uniref:Heparinase n=1 Tax=Pontibacillus marinus BH030004 = DSM 16465 TaxID=1385511 RepID=A0A0A5GH56_9BACI|nr:alginate lyase family protein [Pontibacillus marinus]KGX90445.1 heparinase [Pontibacillus marinus BH030004 = DSM 16465]
MDTSIKKSIFFYERHDKTFLKDVCEKYWKDEVEEVIHRADLACNQTFVFTHRWDMERCETPITFDQEVDWTFRYQGDFEWTVNLNRSRFMAELGQAYWLTGDEKYAQAFIHLMKDWIRQNPLTEEEIQQSKANQYNVKDTWRKLDSGIRITNWIKGYFCVKESEAWGIEEENQFRESLWWHGRYLRVAYTPHDQQSNWGFLETNGLFQIGLLFPHFSESHEWLQVAIQRLESMCELQVFKDGMHNEQSPMYHHEVLHCLFEPVWLANMNGLKIPDLLNETLNAMFTASLAFVKPNGRQPMISDSDHTDIRDVLSRGAVLFNRGDLKYKGYPVLDFEGLWYFGKDGMKTYEALQSHPPSFNSIHLNESGYSIMRDDWSSDEHYLLFDGGHMDIIRAHGHDDFLHFDLSANGSDLLVDTGRYTYMENEERRYFKESFQHNTTSVDDQTISLYQNSWSWDHVAQPVQHFWKSDPSFDYVQAGHNGYWSLDDPVQVLRQIFYVKPHYWILVDTFHSKEEHDYKQHFHFDEHANVEIDSINDSVRIKGRNGSNLNMIQVESVQYEKDTCWISRDYNQKQASNKIRCQKKGKGLTKFITALVPFKENEEPDISIEKVDVWNSRSQKLSEDKVTALQVNRGDESEIIVFSHQGPYSYQFAGTQMTGDVLFVKRNQDQEQKWIVKV